MRTIHIAGFVVRVGNVLRQRCAWCGHLLIERDFDREMVAPGCEDRADGWAVNALVAEESGNPRVQYVVAHVDGEAIPAGWCGDEGKPRLRALP